MSKNPIRVVDGNAQPFAAFWQVRDAEQTGGDAEIDLIGPISEFSWMGDEVTPKKFREDLYAAGKGGPVSVRLHSGGGDIFAASTIRSILAEYPGKVTVNVMGLCASAAVGVALAADEVNIYDTAYFMIHNPAYMFFGAMLDETTMRKMAEDLVVFKEGILNAYENRTGIARDELSAMMDAETWMTAQEAVDKGFADQVITGGRKMDMRGAVNNFVNIPTQLLNAADVEPETEPEDDGQEPELMGQAVAAAQERREKLASRLATVNSKQFGETMSDNMRVMVSAHADKVRIAQALLEVAEEENRDLTEAEQVEFDAALTEAETLSKKIEARAELRARLEAQAGKVGAEAGTAEMPESADESGKKVLTRDEFNNLHSTKKAAFLRGGGKIQD